MGWTTSSRDSGCKNRTIVETTSRRAPLLYNPTHEEYLGAPMVDRIIRSCRPDPTSGGSDYLWNASRARTHEHGPQPDGTAPSCRSPPITGQLPFCPQALFRERARLEGNQTPLPYSTNCRTRSKPCRGSRRRSSLGATVLNSNGGSELGHWCSLGKTLASSRKGERKEPQHSPTAGALASAADDGARTGMRISKVSPGLHRRNGSTCRALRGRLDPGFPFHAHPSSPVVHEYHSPVRRAQGTYVNLRSTGVRSSSA